MQITLDLPEDLLTEISGLEQQLPEVIALGVDELKSRPQEGFNGFAEIMEFLANLPTPEEVLSLRPSVSLQAQIDQLSERYKAEALSAKEALLWKQYEYLEYVSKNSGTSQHCMSKTYVPAELRRIVVN